MPDIEAVSTGVGETRSQLGDVVADAPMQSVDDGGLRLWETVRSVRGYVIPASGDTESCARLRVRARVPYHIRPPDVFVSVLARAA